MNDLTEHGRLPMWLVSRNLVALAAAIATIVAGVPAWAQLTANGQRAYDQYRMQAPNRAFALASNGDGYFWSGTSGHDPGLAVEKVLASCQSKSGAPCRLHAVNNVVVSGADWKQLAPPALAPIGRLRAASWWQNVGPQAAAGLVVWSHGYKPGKDASETAAQPIVAAFVGQGYDYYRFDREWVTSWAADASEVADAVKRAKAMGYRRVILAGQSNGGWVSLAAAGRGAPVDGIVAVSAAAHGEVAKMRDISVARYEWQQLVAAIRPGLRIALVMFDKDEFDVGGRPADARAAFAASGVEAVVVIDSPAGFSGHYAGSNRSFWQLYGACIHGFVEAGKRVSPCN